MKPPELKESAWQKNLICYAASLLMTMLRSGFYGLLYSRVEYSSESLNPSTVSYWVSSDILYQNLSITMKRMQHSEMKQWKDFFAGFNSRDQTLMIPRAFSSVLEKYECKYQEERTATLESLFSKQLELFMFPEMSIAGQRMVLITPRLQVWSPSGPFSEELNWWSMWSLPSQNILWVCDYV